MGQAGEGIARRAREGAERKAVLLVRRARRSKLIREGAQVTYDAHRKPFEERKELVSHPAAQEARVGVGGICGIGKVMPHEVGEYVLLPGVKEGSDEVARPGGQRREATRARSTKEA